MDDAQVRRIVYALVFIGFQVAAVGYEGWSRVLSSLAAAVAVLGAVDAHAKRVRR